MKKEPAAPVMTELDDNEVALKWACRDSIVIEKERLEKAKERQRAALLRFVERRRGRDEGGVVVICDSDDDDDDAPPPVRHGDAEQGSSRGARVKEEKADDDGGDGGEVGAGTGDVAPSGWLRAAARVHPAGLDTSGYGEGKG